MTLYVKKKRFSNVEIKLFSIRASIYFMTQAYPLSESNIHDKCDGAIFTFNRGMVDPPRNTMVNRTIINVVVTKA